jgi:hypothetical protein
MLKTIDEKKSVDLDKIPNKLLKMAADVIAPSLTDIFGKSIHTGIFPYEWKEARVSPMYKNGAKHEPSNYRPISVIPTVSKIFEKNDNNSVDNGRQSATCRTKTPNGRSISFCTDILTDQIKYTMFI